MKQIIQFPIILKPSLKWFYLSIAVIMLLLSFEYFIYIDSTIPWFVKYIPLAIILGVCLTWKGIKNVKMDDQKILVTSPIFPSFKKQIYWKDIKKITRIMDETPHQKNLPTIIIEGKTKKIFIQDHYKEGLNPIFKVAKNFNIKLDFEYEEPITTENDHLRYYEEQND